MLSVQLYINRKQKLDSLMEWRRGEATSNNLLANYNVFVTHITITFSIIDFQMFLLIVTHNKCRITTVTKAKTDIIISITA